MLAISSVRAVKQGIRGSIGRDKPGFANPENMLTKMTKLALIAGVCVLTLASAGADLAPGAAVDHIRRLGQQMASENPPRGRFDCCDSVASSGCNCLDDDAIGRVAFCLNAAGPIPTCAAEQNVSLALQNTTISSLPADAFATWTGVFILISWAPSTPVTLVSNVFQDLPNLQGVFMSNIQGTIPAGLLGPGLGSMVFISIQSPTASIPGCILRNVPCVVEVILASPSLGGGLFSDHPVKLDAVTMQTSAAVLSTAVFDGVFANSKGYALLNVTGASQQTVCCGFESAFTSSYSGATLDMDQGACLPDTDSACQSAVAGTPTCTDAYADASNCSTSGGGGGGGSSGSSSSLF